MDGFDIKDLQGNNLNDFVKNYRDSLDRSYAANNAQIEQQRRNDEASIMAAANRSGMMYSNFPERSKMQYEVKTYLPNREKNFTSYQTGLDKLRSNALNTYNNIKNIEDAIKDLNDATKGNNGTTAWGRADKSAYGTRFFDSNNNPVRFSTWAANNGITSTEDLMKAAEEALIPAEYESLQRIYSAQQNTSHPNLVRYTGDNRKPVDMSYLSGADRALMEALGLTFGG